MLFNSLPFFAFFLAVLGIYWSLRSRDAQLWWLLVASVAFYAYWSATYALIFLALITLNYFGSLLLARTRSPWLLAALVGFDLTFLAWHKYAAFALQTAQTSLGWIHPEWQPAWRLPDIILPLGISFYTFQLIACVVDIYRGHLPLKSWRDFSLFVCFFPHQLAGPIFRLDELVPQFAQKPRWAAVQWEEGLFWILLGLCKKILIADNLAFLVDEVFNDPFEARPLWALLALYAFAFQIYCDFSGYSNMARGLGLLMGFDLIHNFNLPFAAKSFREFWRRWHISLSRWLRDYLYIPLGGNRHGALLTHRNLLLTMILGGLWHGANWTFVVWGAFHGILLSLQHAWDTSPHRTPRWTVPDWIKILAVFHIGLIGWLLFRAESLGEAWHLLSLLPSGLVQSVSPSAWAHLSDKAPDALVALALVIAGHFLAARLPAERVWRLPAPAQAAAALLVIGFLALFAADNRPFIYFRF